MNREQTKELLPAITHFAKGGELVSCRTDEEWFEQSQVYIDTEHLYCSNIIKDQHFEARKAYALGGEVECFDKGDNTWFTISELFWLENVEYRPKPKEVYEWQWYFQENDGEFKLTPFWVEDMHNTHKWTKFEPSKRIRPCKN